VLRRHLNAGQRQWEVWQAGFDALVEACDDPPIDTMVDPMAFWQAIGLLVADDGAAGGVAWAGAPAGCRRVRHRPRCLGLRYWSVIFPRRSASERKRVSASG
jgi:hypothetical protein